MNKKIYLLFFYFVFIFLFITPYVIGLGVTPARHTLDFEAGLSKSLSFTVINSENKDMSLVVYVEGNLAEYITLDESQFSMSSNDVSHIVNYEINLPDILNPGLNTANVIVLQIPEGETLAGPYIGAVLAVTNQLYVHVPYPGKYLEADLNIIEAEQGEDVTFIIPMINRGKLDIVDAKANIDIYNALNERVDSFITPSIFVDSQDRKEIVSKWNANISTGAYKAVVTLIYDEFSLQLEKQFNVGFKVLELKDISVNDFRLGGIAQFDMVVENKWNGSVGEVYTQTKVYNDEGQVMADFKSPTYDFRPLEETILISYWDTAGVDENIYDASVFLKYGEKSTQKDFQFEVSEDAVNIVGLGYVISARGTFFEENRLVMILVVIVFILVILNIIWFVFMRKRLKK